MFAVITSPVFLKEIEQTINLKGESIIYKCVDKDIDIMEELDKLSRLSVKHLIIDISCVEDQKKIPQAIRRYRIMNDKSQIIIIAPNCLPGNEILSVLVTMGVYDIINPQGQNTDDLTILPSLLEHIDNPAEYRKGVKWDVGIKDTFSEDKSKPQRSFSERNRYEQDNATLKDLKGLLNNLSDDEKRNLGILKENEVIEKTIIEDKIIGSVTIGVAGASRGVGSTHTAISLALYLASLGKKHKVAYIEANDKFDIYSINENYPPAKRDFSFTVNGVDFYSNKVALFEVLGMNYYNYIVLDFGVLKYYDKDNKIVISDYYYEFVRCSMSFLVCGGKPWQRKDILLSLYKDNTKSCVESTNWKLLFNHIDSELLSLIKSDFEWPVYSIPYSPDYACLSDDTSKLYTDLLEAILPKKEVLSKGKKWPFLKR